MLASTIWSNAKLLHSISVGPVSVFFRFGRSTVVPNSRFRRGLRKAHRLFNAAPESTVSAIPLRGAAADGTTPAAALQTAVVVGIGPGLGAAIARRFALGGMNVALAARNHSRLEQFERELQESTSATIRAFSCDATRDSAVIDMLAEVRDDMGMPDIVVYSVQGFARAPALNVTTSVFEDHWRQNCLGAFVLAREAATMMLPRGRGTIVLIGSTSGKVARENHLSLAVGKFGLRALAHILARELGPQGIHVAHLIIDADIRQDDLHGPEVPQAEPAHLAELVWMLHAQPRSAWTSELDARPSNEMFWEHC